MRVGSDFLKWVIVFSTVLHRIWSMDLVHSTCELSVSNNNKLYSFSLASPIPKFPHGVLSEDGFYRVAVNETVLWFQLCDGMIFNHDPPMCVDCSHCIRSANEAAHRLARFGVTADDRFFPGGDCGGPSRCGMGCSALVVDNIGGYDVCTTIGRAMSTNISLFDKRNPHIGVVIKMSSIGTKVNCSLSVSVICDKNGVQGPSSLDKLGTCDYATELRHPSGCAKILPAHGKGWGWFSTFMTIVSCLLGGYLLAGMAYRYFFLGMRGLDIVPNLEFWTSLPYRTQSLFASLIRKFRGPSQGHRSSYSAVNF